MSYIYNMFIAKPNNVSVSFFMHLVRIISCILLFAAIHVNLSAQSVIWLEDFDDLPDGTQIDTGPTAWTIDATACNFGPLGSFEVFLNAFQGIDTQGEGIWYSEVIDISGHVDVKITIDLFMYALIAGADDYVRAYYSLDSGPEILLKNGDQTGNFSSATAFAGGINGSTLQIIVKLTNDFLIIPRFQRFDNVKVYTGPDERFAIQSGEWDDPNTWSYYSGGPSCNCIPDVFSDVHINEVDSGYVVSIDSDSRAKELYLYSGGTLQWTSDNDELEIYEDGAIYIQSGATLTENSHNEARIEFAVDQSDYVLDNEGIVIVDDVILQNREGQVTFNGSADITITDQLEFFDAKTTLINNSNGIVYVQDDLLYNGDTTELVNNGTIQITDDIRNNFFGGDNQITNNSGGTLTIGDEVNSFWNGLVIDNYGSIDQNGAFTNIEAGEVQVYNKSGATWNYGGGTTDDDDIRLYCNFNANSFEYDNTGDQQVHPAQDGYWHLVLSNSGTKTTLGDLDINGNLTISGVSILDVNTNNNDITLAGNWTNEGTFNAGSRRVEFDGSTAQAISNASDENFYTLALNNSGTGVTLSDGNITVADTLSMEQGNVFTNAFKVTVGTGTAAVGVLSHTSGTVIGRVERWISSPGSGLLFPVGTVGAFRSANGTFNTLHSGSIVGEFVAADPGSDGLPLTESGITIQKHYTDGYWNFVAGNGFSTSDFNIELIAEDFASYPIKPVTRIIKRTDSGNWGLDGIHVDAIDSAVYRDNITGGLTTSGTQFGLGIGCLPVTITAVIQDVACYGGSDGAIDITVTGGTSPFVYLWSTSDGSGLVPTSEDQTGLTTGTYDLMITDGNGCDFYDSFEVSQPAAPLSGSITFQTNVACYGDSTGTITVAGQGGTSPYEYCLDGGTYQGSGTFTDLPAGDFIATIRDANLCIYDVPVTITEPASALGGSIQSQTNVLCFGDPTGSVTVTGTGGIPPHEYSLDGGLYQSSGEFTGLVADDYTITVRDANFCVLDLSVTITQPLAPLTGSITSQVNVGCFGEATGSVTLLGAGGTSPYEYCLDGGTYQASGTFGGLTADIYTVTVRDANGCTTDVPVTITEPLALTGSITIKVNVACFGDATGSVTITGSDGTLPYQYSLDGGSYQSSGTFDNLIADDYTVTIRDANLCTVDIPVTITEPTEFTASIVTQTNVDCYGNATGSVAVSGAGGTTPYQYSLDGGAFQSSGTFNDLVTKVYTITVMDANSCTFDILVTITEPEELSGVIVELYNACFGEASGFVTLQGGNGIEPYEYSLDGGPFQSSGTFTGLVAGDYIITIRDANSCTTDIPVTITQAATALTGSLMNQTNVRCYGDATGSLTIAGSGGTPPYEYSFDGADFQTSGTFNNLIASGYVVTIRDANHCAFTIPVTITQPASGLTGSITEKTDVLCPDDETGEVTVTASGGTPPYEYCLNGGSYQTDNTFSGLAASDYTVRIRDANLCTVDFYTTVEGPPSFEINPVVTGESCEGVEDGSIILNPSGGTPPYALLWSNGETTENLNNIGAGIYVVTITDTRDCIYEYDIEVVLIGEDCLLIPNAFIPNNDGMNDTWRIRSIESYPNATVHIFSRWGQLVFSAENGYTDPWDGTYKGKDLPMDSYFYVIDLKNGREPITGQVTIIR